MNESILKTIGVAFSVCLVCSLVVSTSAVSLRDLQKVNTIIITLMNMTNLLLQKIQNYQLK